jgi:hypothetical protein
LTDLQDPSPGPGVNLEGVPYVLILTGVRTMEKCLRKVTKSFTAKTHYKEPPVHETFSVGDLLIYRREERGHSVFTRESDPEGAAPFMADSEIFKQSTESR